MIAKLACVTMVFLLSHLTPQQVKVPSDYDPLALARASSGLIQNLEATVPPQCYTLTDGVSNPCWTCHTPSTFPNQMDDIGLQSEYAFSDQAMNNAWSNLFVDRTAEIAAIGDEEILDYVRTDNYTALRQHLEQRTDYRGYKPDLDFERGFDQHGFARDGSHWRAFRYKPFPGDFWPTNGSTDDVLIRLAKPFRSRGGVEDLEIYKINLALVEAAIAAGPSTPAGAVNYETEPLDEQRAGIDLDGDGRLGTANLIAALPSHYVGDAADVGLVRYLYPTGCEFLHSVRYLDPAAPSFIAKRMKELRYSRKMEMLDSWAINHRYEREYGEKEEGRPPTFSGAPEVGLRNGFGWQLQGYIEDSDGLLRLQTHEEHQACMGCHSSVGVTVDQTFALARKLPGLAGWAYQSIEGMADVPQQGHSQGEIATYLARVKGADPFRANEEMLARFFDSEGRLREQELQRTLPGGDRDIAWLLLPSRERALKLDKAYRALVKTQTFNKGRDTVVAPARNVQRRIANGSTDLEAAGKVYDDGKLWLNWHMNK